MIYREEATAVIMYGSEQVAEVQIEPTSVRRVMLMKEDYIRLDFTLDKAIGFRRGCSVEDELFGRFVLRKEQMPKYRAADGSYKYEIQFDAEYLHLEDYQYTLIQTKESPTQKDVYDLMRESLDFSFTADLYGQVSAWMDCVKAIGFDLAFDEQTDTSITEDTAKSPHDVELMSFSRTAMLTALKQICDKWGVEYWFVKKNNALHLCIGKCEAGTSFIDFEEGVNVATMGISNGLKTYANRIYAYGGKSNIAYDYRKVIQNSTTDWYSVSFPGTNKPGFVVFKLYNNSKPFRENIVNNNFFDYKGGTITGNQWPKSTSGIYNMQWLNVYFQAIKFRESSEAISVQAPYIDCTATVTLKVTVGSTTTTKDIAFSGQAKRNRSYWQYYTDRGNVYDDFTIGEMSEGERVVNRVADPYAQTSGYSFVFSKSSESFTFDDNVKTGNIVTNVAWEYEMYSGGSVVASDSANDTYNSPGRNQVTTDVISYNFYYAIGNWGRFDVLDDRGSTRTTTTIYIKHYDKISDIVSDGTDAEIINGDDDNGGLGYYLFSQTPVVDWNGTGYSDKVFGVSDLVGVLYRGYNGTTYGSTTEPRSFKFESADPDVPSALFTTPQEDPSSLIRLGDERLRMPKDIGDCIQTPEAEVFPIEECVIFDNIYPKLEFEVASVTAVAKTEKQVYEGEDYATFWNWKQYFVQLAFLDGGALLTSSNFSTEYIIDGETLQLKFVTPRDFDKNEASYADLCKMAGMTFDVEWMPNGTWIEDPENAQQTINIYPNGCFKVIRNETYGAKLPCEELAPQEEDLCTLIGISLRRFSKTSAYTDAEARLYDKATEYLAAIKEGNFTFDCVMLAEWMRSISIDASEGVASESILAFTLPSPSSTAKFYIGLGGKVRILHPSLSSLVDVTASTGTVEAEDFGDFYVGLYVALTPITIPDGQTIRAYTENSLFLIPLDASEILAVGQGEISYTNDTGSELEVYVGEGAFQVFNAEELLEEEETGFYFVENPIYILPGQTINVYANNGGTAAICDADDFLAYGEDDCSWTNNTQSTVEVWFGTKDAAWDGSCSVVTTPSHADIVLTRKIGAKESRVIGYELKLDCPEDGARYTIGETEAYSRLNQIEKEISSNH